MAEDRTRIAIRQEVSHLQVHHPGFKEDQEPVYCFDTDSLETILRNMPNVQAFSVRAVVQGMLATASGSNGVQINGVGPEAEQQTRDFSSMVKTGAYLDPAKRNQVMVGKKLADKMKLNIGAKIVLTFQDQSQNIVSGAFRICGVFESANAPLDERNVYVRREDLSVLLDTPGKAQEAAILLHDEGRLAETQSALAQHFPDLLVENWQTISPETALITTSIDTSSLIIMTIIMLALAFGIINTMLMAVLERTREIGMLMAVGMAKLRVFGMIVLETLLLTLAGSPLGVILTWITVSQLRRSGIDLSAIAGNLMKGFGYGSVIYPELPVEQVIRILQIVIITALIASVFPAWKALRLRPAEAVRL